jgi:protein-L-isoaspartate(D-aspartate) O-methyltransferase
MWPRRGGSRILSPMHDVAGLIDELRPYVADERVLRAIAAVPRERFVPESLHDRAYENCALGIGCGQTISQPLVVARMSELLELGPTDRVLDVGTGSGYHAAVLARLAEHVWSIERHERLSRRAAASLEAAGVRNVTLVVGDGTRGLPEAAPFDAVNVAAAGSAEGLADLEEQLAPGGRLVAPVSGPPQRLAVVRRTPRGLERTLFEEVRFVPLVRGEG